MHLKGVYLFASNVNGVAGKFSTATIYGMTVDQNGKRIATIYPAKLNDGTVCFYDETRGLILKANGTGKLIAVE